MRIVRLKSTHPPAPPTAADGSTEGARITREIVLHALQQDAATEAYPDFLLRGTKDDLVCGPGQPGPHEARGTH
jgi:hypothetical protein